MDTLGNEIAPTQTLANGKSGDGFVTPAAPTVAGYELLDPATQSGAFTDGQQNITVKYAKVTATNTNASASAATTASIATSEAQAPISEVAVPEIPTISAATITSSATVTTPASAVSSAAVPQTSATPNVASKQAATSVAPVQPTSVAPSSNAEITVQPAIANNAIQPTNQLSQAPASDSANADRPSAVGLTSEQARQAIAAAARIANTKFQAPVAFDTGTSARTGQQIQPVDLNVQAFTLKGHGSFIIN